MLVTVCKFDLFDMFNRSDPFTHGQVRKAPSITRHTPHA